MSNGRATDAELISVSIIAGPAAGNLLSQLVFSAERQVALLTTSSSWSSQFAVARHEPNSAPDAIVERIRQMAGQGETTDLIIQCESERPVMAYASLFAANTPGDSALSDVARLTSTTFVIKTTDFLNGLLNLAPTSEHVCFMTEQIEFVDRVVFDDAGDDFELARSIVTALNPEARAYRLEEAASNSMNPSPRPFDFSAALQRAGWRQLLDGVQAKNVGGRRITALGYSAWRPFHPERFWNFLHHHAKSVFRAKGFFWLASRMNEVGGLNLAGADLHCSSAGGWWATRDADSRTTEMPEEAKAQWREPFGDRRQTFGILAVDLDAAALRSSLDVCLLTDAEMSTGPEAWRELPDPFPSWSHHHHHHHHEHSHAHEHGDECDHPHGSSDEHHCCHH